MNVKHPIQLLSTVEQERVVYLADDARCVDLTPLDGVAVDDGDPGALYLVPMAEEWQCWQSPETEQGA